MTEQSIKYYSITKFVNFMNEKFKNIKGIVVYFEAENMFKNKFGKLCIKPVMLKITTSLTTLNDEYLKHQKILDLFEAQPVLSFNEGKKHWFEKDKSKLMYLTVDFKLKEYNGIKYYPSEMFQCLVQKNIDLIRKNKVSIPFSKLEPIIEEEISPDEI